MTPVSDGTRVTGYAIHEMLPATNRLRKTNEIERVWKRGRSFFDPLVQMKVARNDLAVTRFAVVVGTKADKRAVRRNLVKRRIREALRQTLPEIAPGYDAIVTGTRAAIAADYAAIAGAVRRVLAGAKLVAKR